MENKQSINTTPLLSFNAKSVDCKDLEATLVGRKEVVDEIFNELLEKLLENETYQSLLVAQRGSGKTHMTKVLYCRIKSTEALKEKVIVAYMTEDEYGVGSFVHLLLQILEAIKRYKEPNYNIIEEEIKKISFLPHDQQEASLKNFLFNYLGNKTLIVLIENFDVIIEGLDAEAAKLRDIIHEKNNLCLIASSQSLSKKLKDSKYPFYHFFKSRYLEPMTSDQSLELIKALIQIEKNSDVKQKIEDELSNNTIEFEAKVRAMHYLSAGNHRLITHFYQFLRADIKTEFAQVFIKQMNDLKSYYEQFIKELSFQQQRIVQVISLNRIPINASHIASKSFIEVNTVTKQLSELFKIGYIDKHKSGKEVYYELKEPLMRICFEINENPDGAAALFVTFLKSVYSERELQKKYLLHELHSINLSSEIDRSRHHAEAEFYLKAINMEDPVFQLGLKNLHYKKSEKPEAILNQAINELHEICINLIKDGKFDEMEEKMNVAILNDSKNGSLYEIFGDCLLNSGKFEKAIAVYNKLIEIDVQNPFVYVSKGLAQSLLGDYEKALESYNKSMELNIKTPFVYWEKGRILNLLGKYIDSIIQYELGLSIGKETSYALQGKANSLYQLGRKDEAIINYNRALELDNENVDAYSGKGLTLFSQGKVNEAIEQYEVAMKLNENNQAIYFMLMSSIFIKEDIKAFEKVIQKYMKKIKSFDIEMWQKFVNLLAWERPFSKAISYFEIIHKEFDKIGDEFFLLGIWEKSINQIIIALNEFDFTDLTKLISYLDGKYSYENRMIMPLKFLRIGIKYHFEKDSKALLQFSKEERDLFLTMITYVEQ